MKMQESAEDYLEMILILKERIKQVRSIDIVNEMGYTKPSVSLAMKKLRENGYIKMDADGYITLENSGLEIATQMYDRHKFFTQFLMTLGVCTETALKDACKMEHAISDESYQCIRKYFEHPKND